MPNLNRRSFLAASLGAATFAADLRFLAPLSHAAAADTAIDPGQVTFGLETDRLLRLLRSTSREECIPAFIKEIQNGLSYSQFLTVLFLAAVDHGDPHQVAQVYGAHRIGNDLRIEERLLPLFWILLRIKQESESNAPGHPALKRFRGILPSASTADALFREGLLKHDSAEAERAALALARDRGPRYVMRALWEFAPRNLGGNLGHPAIALANGYRALEGMGWQHAQVALRYVTTYISGYEGDNTYAAALEKVARNASKLPLGWASSAASAEATVLLFNLIRAGKSTEATDFICAELISGKITAGTAWDAIALAAADSVARHKTGGGNLGAQIHAVTTVNALHFGFDLVDANEVKLINLLQAAGVLCDFYVGHMLKEGNLRDITLLDLATDKGNPTGSVRDVFEMLPRKAREHFDPKPAEREASDRSSQLAFHLLEHEKNYSLFQQTARSFLCVKATMDPHDIKFPAAIFEDAVKVSPVWKPYIFAASVHSLHGAKSPDTPVLTQVRDAMKA